jgi:tetratricopeptide (TPR) repeat protein
MRRPAALAAIALSAALIARPGAAQECPPVPDQSARLAELFASVQAAPDAAAARADVNAMWEIWATAPDPRAQELLDLGMQRRAAFDLDAATEAFDRLVAYCPHYAEGYNQRAFVSFIRQDYGAALDDLERVMELAPDHVPAMTGLALSLMQLGRVKAGQGVLRRALRLNPWLPERSLLIGPPEKQL